MTVSELIEALQQMPNQDAEVQFSTVVAGAAVATVVASGASGTFPLDAPEAEYGANGGAQDPGIVTLND